MTTVLLIHGINNEENSKETIEESWSNALRLGAAAADLAMPDNLKFIAAFYGDVLLKETENWGKNKPASRPMSAASPDEDYANDEVAALYLEFQREYGISDAQVSQELDKEDQQTYRRMAKGIHKKWLKAIARSLEKVLPSKGKRAMRSFLPQAAAYLYKPGLKEKIDKLVKEQILDGLPEDENIVIISHSLGTIVAYALMFPRQDQTHVGLLLTAGSPLGIEVVKLGLGTQLICLKNVAKWVNVSDREDFVALRPELTGKTFGCDEITNIDVDNGKEDAHDILKYLAHSTVAKEIIPKL
jgi:hypothetical protein